MPKAPEPSSTCQKTTKSLPRISPKSYRHNAVPTRFSSRFSTSLTNGPRLPSSPKAGTHSPLLKGSHTTAHTAKHGPFRTGALLLPSDCFTHFGSPAWPGGRTANFAVLSFGRACSRRTQKAFGAAMRLCASLLRRRRGPAGLQKFYYLVCCWRKPKCKSSR